MLPTLLAVFLAGCGEKLDPNEPQGFLQTKGSDTIVNAMQETAEEFMKDYPHVFVAVTGGGSGVGIASLINKTTEIATASREMKGKEIEMAEKRGVHPREFVVAYDGVAVIVNHNNPIDRLSIEDLHDIFTGKATNWKQLGGRDLPIVTLSREVSSGTHMYFKEEVVQLGKKGSTEEFSKETLLLTSSQAIVEEVAGNEGAIGYLGMGYLSDRTKAVLVGRGLKFEVGSLKSESPDPTLETSNLKLQTSDVFYPPTVENVVNKKYPLSRPLYVYTDGEPQGITKLFIGFTLGPKGQAKFMGTGFVPIGETVAAGQ
ncbi:MAG: phosphate ABC transporter substrate-binding protein [Phycisphaerales bacterium]